MRKKLEPVNNVLIVRPDAAEDKTASGVLIDQTSQKRPLRGTILAVGPTVRCEPEVKEGDHVLYPDGSGHVTIINNDELLILRDAEIFSIIRNDDSK